MTSFTSWTRLEPRPRTASLEESLEARICDPLWMLGRQWQLGEFQGEDAGTPIQVDLETEVSALDTLAIGGKLRDYDAEKYPLEAVVEQELLSHNSIISLRSAAESGLQLFRMLGMLEPLLLAKYRGLILSHYALQAPVAAASESDHPLDSTFRSITAGRLPDGYLVEKEWRPWIEGNSGAPTFIDSESDKDKLRSIGGLWLEWCKTILMEPEESESAWVPERLSYDFSVSASTSQSPQLPPAMPSPDTGERIALHANEYRGGRLDWFSFDVGPLGPHAARTPVLKPLISKSMLPTPLTFRGMPSSRWWEFENAQVNLGNIDVAPEDLSRLLLIECALCYSNDYFVVPIALKPGALCRITKLNVTNTFGETVSVEQMDQSARVPDGKPWRMFSISDGPTGQLPHLFLAPALSPTIDSDPVEKICIVRDEMANIAWAIEKKVESPAGYALDLQERSTLRSPANAVQPVFSDGPTWTYQLATEVPAHWLPFIPVQLPKPATGVQNRAVIFQRSGEHLSSGHILSQEGANFLREEEVPRRGVEVTRSYQLARWIHGETYVWSTRAVTSGRGEASSGLAFDKIGSISSAEATSNTDFAAQVLADNPIAYYRMSESAGATIAVDSSANANHGALSSSGITLEVAGLGTGDKATLFDGLGSGRLVVANSATLNPVTITIEALISWSGDNGFQQRIIEKSRFVGGDSTQYGLSILPDGKVRLEVQIGAADVFLDSTMKAQPGQVCHLAACYDGNLMRIYFNGVLDVEIPTLTGGLPSNSTNLSIGNQVDRDRPFKGIIDEIALYSKALSTGRIRAHARGAGLR